MILQFLQRKERLASLRSQIRTVRLNLHSSGRDIIFGMITSNVHTDGEGNGMMVNMGYMSANCP